MPVVLVSVAAHRRRLAAITCAATLVVAAAGCSDDQPEPQEKKKIYPVGEGADQPGKVVGVGRLLTVVGGPTDGPKGLVGIKLLKVQQGKPRDLRQFTLDSGVRSSSVYYAHVRLSNRSTAVLSGFRPLLYGQISRTEVVPSVRFGSTFAPCPPDQTGRTFKPHSTMLTCYVFLVPDDGDLKAVQYRFAKPKWPALTWSLS